MVPLCVLEVQASGALPRPVGPDGLKSSSVPTQKTTFAAENASFRWRMNAFCPYITIQTPVYCQDLGAMRWEVMIAGSKRRAGDHLHGFTANPVLRALRAFVVNITGNEYACR